MEEQKQLTLRQVRIQVPEGCAVGTMLSVPVQSSSDCERDGGVRATQKVQVRIPEGVLPGDALLLTQVAKGWEFAKEEEAGSAEFMQARSVLQKKKQQLEVDLSEIQAKVKAFEGSMPDVQRVSSPSRKHRDEGAAAHAESGRIWLQEASFEAELEQREAALPKDLEIAERNAALAQHRAMVAERDAEIAYLREQLKHSQDEVTRLRDQEKIQKELQQQQQVQEKQPGEKEQEETLLHQQLQHGQQDEQQEQQEQQEHYEQQDQHVQLSAFDDIWWQDQQQGQAEQQDHWVSLQDQDEQQEHQADHEQQEEQVELEQQEEHPEQHEKQDEQVELEQQEEKDQQDHQDQHDLEEHQEEPDRHEQQHRRWVVNLADPHPQSDVECTPTFPGRSPRKEEERRETQNNSESVDIGYATNERIITSPNPASAQIWDISTPAASPMVPGPMAMPMGHAWSIASARQQYSDSLLGSRNISPIRRVITTQVPGQVQHMQGQSPVRTRSVGGRSVSPLGRSLPCWVFQPQQGAAPGQAASRGLHCQGMSPMRGASQGVRFITAPAPAHGYQHTAFVSPSYVTSGPSTPRAHAPVTTINRNASPGPARLVSSPMASSPNNVPPMIYFTNESAK